MTNDKKVYAGSCDLEIKQNTAPDGRILGMGKPVKVCKDKALAPTEVTYTKGSESLGSAGCHCLPKNDAWTGG